MELPKKGSSSRDADSSTPKVVIPATNTVSSRNEFRLGNSPPLGQDGAIIPQNTQMLEWVRPRSQVTETSEVFKTSEVCLESWTDPAGMCFRVLTYGRIFVIIRVSGCAAAIPFLCAWRFLPVGHRFSYPHWPTTATIWLWQTATIGCDQQTVQGKGGKCIRLTQASMSVRDAVR